MAADLLDNAAVSAFCGSVSSMLSAGIQIDEGTSMLSEGDGSSKFRAACRKVYLSVIDGDPLSEAMKSSGAFPTYCTELVQAGERSGHLEEVLATLEQYYDQQARTLTAIRSNVNYPAGLLCVTSAILLVIVTNVLPVFVNVYQGMSGNIASGSFSWVSLAVVIGWISLIACLVCTAFVLMLSFSTRGSNSSGSINVKLARIPNLKQAVYQIELSHFTVALEAYVSSGITNDEAMQRAMSTVELPLLKERLQKAYDSMVDLENPKSLVQAISENEIFEPFYSRMLEVGAQAGSVDEVLSSLSRTFFDDAVDQIERVVDQIEPVLAAFFTVAVGTMIVAVMIPLIGIMGSIG